MANPYSTLGPDARTPAGSRPKNRLKTPQARMGLFALGTMLALTFSMTWNPPTGSIHDFTTASDYKLAKDSGCTNSGKGCHGKESSYTDFNAYHPNAECTTCHEYQGVGCIPCHAPREHECAACHDGSMENAADTVRLTDSYPNGHYRETSHTVEVASMRRTVKATAEGEAEAACKDCHSSDLRKAHTRVTPPKGSKYGPDLGCGECHNDTGTRGQAEVIANWKTRRCESCHKPKTKAPWHGVDSIPSVTSKDRLGCGDTGDGCHTSADLHALHPNKPASCSGSTRDGEPGCHQVSDGKKENVATSCGGADADACHKGSDGADYEHENMDVHAPESYSAGADTSFYGIACSSCHHMEPDGVSMLVEHAGGAVLGRDAGSCRACHNAAASRDALEAETFECDVCHGKGILSSAHSADLVAAHSATSGSGGCASTGPGCHSSNLFAIGDQPGALHLDCLRCHAKRGLNGSRGYDPDMKTCGSGRSCHNETGAFDPATAKHAIGGKPVGGTDAEYHTAGSALAQATYQDEASGLSTVCSSCHSMVLGAEHMRSSSSMRGDLLCTRCHNASATAVNVVKSGWRTRTKSTACAECHDGSEGTPARHGSIESAHTGIELGSSGTAEAGSCSGTGCHPTADLRRVHRDKGCALAGCHSSKGSIITTGLKTCGGPDGGAACHTASKRHASSNTTHAAIEVGRSGAPEPGACAKPGCHVTVDVRALHTTLRCGTAGCHGEGGPTLKTCGGPDGGAACHTASTRHRSADAKHAAIELSRSGSPEPGSCAKPGCHVTVDVRRLHPELACATPGCHVAGGPTSKTCGGPDGGAACHTASKRHTLVDAKHAAIELGSDDQPSPGSCVRADCHATGDVRTLHTSLGCGTVGCHVADGPTFRTCGGSDAASGSCHIASKRHQVRDGKQQATQYSVQGSAEAAACVSSGCHTTTDTHTLHASTRCGTSDCHSNGGPKATGCGGANGDSNCHLGYSRSQHFQSHEASLTGSHSGVSYGPGENTGCLGACHASDLIAVHRAAAGSMEGSAASVCRVCHYDRADRGSGAFSNSSAIVRAVSGHDRRCTSCHSSGSSIDSRNAVASPPSTCIPFSSATASDEPVSTADIFSGLETTKRRLTASVAHMSAPGDPTTGDGTPGGTAVRDADGSSVNSTEAPPAPKPSDSSTDNADVAPDASKQPEPDASKQPEPAPEDGTDQPAEPAEPKPDCPSGATDPDKDAPELDADEESKSICLKCHEVKATGADGASNSEESD